MTERPERRREIRLIGLRPIAVAPIPVETILFTHPRVRDIDLDISRYAPAVHLARLEWFEKAPQATTVLW
jgi:hypothetical protein